MVEQQHGSHQKPRQATNTIWYDQHVRHHLRIAQTNLTNIASRAHQMHRGKISRTYMAHVKHSFGPIQKQFKSISTGHQTHTPTAQQRTLSTQHKHGAEKKHGRGTAWQRNNTTG